MKAVFVLLVGLILASAVVAGPLFGSIALDEVNECSELTRFKEGYQYTFRYEAETESGIRGAGPDSTTTTTTVCDITIEAPERCRNVLKVTRCDDRELGREMSAHDVVFRTDKGRITEVLAHPDEPIHILNMKRGILSMVQLDLEADDVDQITLNEVSVHGNCSSEMTVTRRDDKQRPRNLEVATDLNGCMLRKRPEEMTRWQSFMDTVLNTTVVDKFINSSKICFYNLKGTSGEYKDIRCEEVHSFWPMNFNSENGIRTSITQTLISDNIFRLNSFKIDPANTRSTCLRYEHDPSEVGKKPDDVTADQAMDILKALVKSSREEVKMESPRLFGRWRSALEGMTNETIHEVFNRAYNCSEYSQTCRDNPDKEKIAREYLLDGLLPCTTLACFSVKNYAIAKGVIPKPLANAWMVTMAFRSYPTLDLMSEMLRMAQYAPSQMTIFPLSIMIHNYWVNNEEVRAAGQLPEPITNTIRYLKSLIDDDCSVAPETLPLTLIAMKAIGNIGEPVQRYDQITFAVTDKITPTLIACTKNNRIPSDISKAAVQAMRRFEISEQLRGEVVVQLFMDVNLDVPQRIAAYLIAMKDNPSSDELRAIWTFLKTEPVNQIKAFCYSHIENILESSEPTLQELQQKWREAMGEDQLPEYPKDIRKFSRFFEFSKNITEPWRNNTVAAQLESSLIFNPESYLPQEVMFHYVLNALGKQWDLFETGIEMKGFEPILESVFGPEGIFPEVNLYNLFDTIDEKFLSKIREFAEEQLERWTNPEPEAEPEPVQSIYSKKKDKYAKKVKRQSQVGEPQIIDVIHQTTMDKLNHLHYDLVNMQPSATDATIFLRLLGNEFGFISASDFLAIIPYTMGIYEELKEKTKQIPTLLAQGLNLNTTRSMVFMDKSFIIPTGIGMPLNCSMNGTAVVSLRLKSQFSIELPRIIAAGHIAPSGAIEVLATMGIGLPTKTFTGVMANATIYHSSKIAGNVTIDGTRMKINLNNTDQPMNLFNYSTTYNLLKANGEVQFIPGVLQDAVRTQKCTNVSRVLGVDLCVSWAYPNASYAAEAPRFPFAGPNSFNVTLVNTDKALKAYTIDAQYKQIREEGGSAPKTFSSIGKRSKKKVPAVTKLIDTVRLSFYAPGEELTRNITSMASFDRLRRTAKWTFAVPEVKDFTMFAGFLNESTESTPSYRAVFNVSAAENKASVDFLVRNEKSSTINNMTAVFNASINSLYFATVGQFVKAQSSGDWNAHLTETYYWDDETPLYKQVLFPWFEYEINHEKYRTSSVTAMRRTNGPMVQRNLHMDTLGWAFDINTEQTFTDERKQLAISAQISNETWVLPLMDAQWTNTTTNNGYRHEVQIGRNTHHVFAEYDVTKEDREVNRNFRTGMRTDVFVNNPDAAMFMNSPALLRLFGETALIDQPIEIDAGINFRILNQSAQTNEYRVETSIFVTDPRDYSNHLSYDFDLHLENATMQNQIRDYSLELTTPIPLLKMSNINVLRFMFDIESGTSSLDHTYTLYDTRYNKQQFTVSNEFNAGWKKPSANWNMNMRTPSMVYFQNYTAKYSRENGIQVFYETSEDSSFSDLLDFTEISNWSVKPSAASMYWSYLHQLISANVSNSLVLDGPITEMCPRAVPRIIRDIANKTYQRDFASVKEIILNRFINNITSSSLTLRQSANVSSPIVANASVSHEILLRRDIFDQKFQFTAQQQRLGMSSYLNHSFVFENLQLSLKTEGSLLKRSIPVMLTSTSLNVTLSTPFIVEALHHSKVESALGRFSTNTSFESDITDVFNVFANHTTTISSGTKSLDVNGNFTINRMASPTYFDDITGILTYKLKSSALKSSLDSSISFENFKQLFKFKKVVMRATHDIKSNALNWDAQTKSQLKGFSSIYDFDEVSTSLVTNLVSKYASGSHRSGFNLLDMNAPLQFRQLSTYLSNNITSCLVNSTYETGFNVDNSEVNFASVDGTSNYILSSRLLNVTANNTLLMSGFRSLFNFDSITGNQIWFMKTRLLNTTMDNAVALRGFEGIVNFNEITGHVSGNLESCFAHGNTNTTLLVQTVRSISNVAKVAVDSSSSFTSCVMNSSLTGGLDVTNHRSFLDFDSISSMTNFTSKVFNVSSSIWNEVSFNGVRSFVNFESISHSFGMKGNSYYVNSSMTDVITLRNFRGVNQFDLASAEFIATFVTSPVQVSYHQINKVENMNGWFQYPLAETVVIGNLTSCKLNVFGSYEGRIINMVAPFNYDSSIAKVEYAVNNRMLNITGFHGVQVDTMRGFFNFRRINGTISHEVITPLTNMHVGGLLEMNNFLSVFNFERMSMTTANIFTITPLTRTYASYNGGLTFEGFQKFNKFSSITGTSNTAVLTKWTNWTMNMDSAFTNMRSCLDFDRLAISAQNEFTSPFIVMASNTTNFITGSGGFFKASNATTNSMFGLTSRIVKVDAGVMWTVRDLSSPVAFAANLFSSNMNISTPIIKSGSALKVDMENWQNLTKFGKYEVTAANDITSRIAKWNVLSHFKLENMNGILTYTRMEGSASSKFSSIISSLNASINAHINNQAGFFTYDEMIVSTEGIFSSWPLKMNGSTDFNVQNMAGFMMYDSITGSATTGIDMRLLKADTQSNLIANRGTGLFAVELANVTSGINIKAPLTKEVRASGSAQVTGSRKLFNFDKAAINGEFSFLTAKINVTGNAGSVLTRFENITSFESAESSADLSLASKYFNSSSQGIVQMEGFERVFKFADVKVAGITTVKSIVNLTTEAGINFKNFESLFNFERVNSSALVSLTSKGPNITGITGMEMINFRGPLTFDRFNGSLMSKFIGGIVNSTTRADFSLENFVSLFKFSRVAAAGESVLDSKMVNGRVIADYAVTDSSCFCKFGKLEATSAGSLAIGNADAQALATVELKNMRNMASFELFNVTSQLQLNSQLITAMSKANYSIKNHQGLFRFDDVASHMFGNIRSKLVNSTGRFDAHMINSRGFFNFDSAASHLSGNVDTKLFNSNALFVNQMNNSRHLLNFDAAKSQLELTVGDAQIGGQLNLIDFVSMTQYRELSAMAFGNITHRLLTASGISRFNVTNMSGIMTFERAFIDVFGNIQSSVVESTIKNSFEFTGFQGMQFNSIGHRFVFLWVDGFQNDVTVKNGLDITTLREMSQLFNITWKNAVDQRVRFTVNQRLNYENLEATLKIPSLGFISGGANLNTFGDVLTFTVNHGLKSDNYKTVNDITWLLKLNESNVIYSNFSWNPETIAKIETEIVDALNSTFNRTVTFAKGTANKIMEVANRTLTHTRRMTNCTKCFMRYTIMMANETLTPIFSELNQTFFSKALMLNETIFCQLKKLNQTVYERLQQLNQTFYLKLQEFKENITFARENPRAFVGRFVNMTKVNKTIAKLKEVYSQLNATLREMYAKLRYNITHPRETIDNIKILIKYDERLQKIKWVIENRNALKRKAIKYMQDLKQNVTIKAEEKFAEFKELIKYEARFELAKNYIQARLNIPKFQEKLQDIKMKMAEIRQQMINQLADFNMTAREKMANIKAWLVSLEKEQIKAQIQVQLLKIQNFILHYLNRTTIEAINSSIFIDYKEDAQVQELMRKIIRIRPRNVIDIINMTSVQDSVEVTQTKAGELREKMVLGLETMNQTTYRYINKTFVNETALQVIDTLREWNATFHEYVYVDVIKSDLMFIFNITKEQAINITKAVKLFINDHVEQIKTFIKEKWDARPRSLEELKQLLMQLKATVVESIKEKYNIDIEMYIEKMQNEFTAKKEQLVAKMGEKYTKAKEQIDEMIVKIIAISRNETHPVNMLPLCYFNRTIYQIVQPSFNMTKNYTVEYSLKAIDWTQVFIKNVTTEISKQSVVSFNRAVDKTKEFVKMVKDLKKVYTPKIVEALKKFNATAFEKAKILKERVIIYYNNAKENVTYYYVTYAPVVNETIFNFTVLARNAINEYTLKAINITETYINMTIEFLEPHVQPYREIMQDKVNKMMARAEEYKEKIRNLPAQTETFLMDTAEYHIGRYPLYKQNILRKMNELNATLTELKVNLTRFYNEKKEFLIVLYGDLRQNATILYNNMGNLYQQAVRNVSIKYNALKVKVQGKWRELKPIIIEKYRQILTKTNNTINGIAEAIVFAAKDEFSLINELPMRALDKTIYTLSGEFREYVIVLRDNAKERVVALVEQAKMTIQDPTSLINKYPVKYLHMTIYEAGNLSKEKILMAANLTKTFANKTLTWANATLVRANQTLYKVITASNTTLREIVIPYLNQTYRDVVIIINRTISQPWRVTLNETITYLNQTSIVLFDKANNTFITIQGKAIEAWKNLTSEESIARMKMLLNNTRDQIIRTIRSANETIYLIRNKTIELVIYVRDETPLLNLTKKYAVLAKNITINSIDQARKITNMTVFYAKNMTQTIVTYIQGPAKDFTMEYVTYVNNSMAGWAIRYYEVDQLPAKAGALLATVKPVERTVNLTMVAIYRTRVLAEIAYNQSQDLACYALNQTRIMTQYALNQSRVISQYALNQTRVMTQYAVNQTRLYSGIAINKTSAFTKQAINRTRTLIRDTIDRIMRFDDHSIAMNISHPFNWTSFRSLPRLTNSQIQYIQNKMMYLNNTIQGLRQINITKFVQELRVNMTAKFQELHNTNVTKVIQELRDYMNKTMLMLREKMMEKYNNISIIVNDYYTNVLLQKPMIIAGIKRVNATYQAVRIPVEEKWREWEPVLREKMEEILAKWEADIKPEIQQYIERTKVRMNELMVSWEVQIKPMIKEYIATAKLRINETWEVDIKPLINATIANMTQKMNDLIARWEEQVKPKIQQSIENIRQKMNEMIAKWENEIKPKIMEGFSNSKEQMYEMAQRWEEEIKPLIKEAIANITRYLRDPELMTKLKEDAYIFVNTTLPEVKMALLEKKRVLQEKYTQLKTQLIEEIYPDLQRRVLAKYEDAKAIFEELKRNATLLRDNIIERVNALKEPALEKWAELVEKVKEYKANLYQKAAEKWNELLDKIKQFKEDWPEFYEQLKNDILDVKVQAKAKLDEYITKILKVLQNLRIPFETLPLEHIRIYSPWKSSAMIFGDNHVMTFDGKVFSVPEYVNEQRTYVLAHDFDNRNFTLLVQKLRITLVLRNMSISIDDTNAVRINGSPMVQELPYQTPVSKEMTVMAKGPWVNVTTSKGIALSCHNDHFMCIFHLSDWYHSKTRGLFGNFDKEHHNEFVLPEGTITSDLDEFISAYDVSPVDMPRNVVPSRLGSCRSDMEKCHALFESESSFLNDTFQDINQAEFYNFCLERTRACRTTCDASNPVVTLGKDLLRIVNYDPECSTCNEGDVTNENGRPTTGADIIFVVSENAAMAQDNVIKTGIKTIINKINNKLNENGVRDIRFGITAYGGSDIHGRPHSHTLCGHLMHSSVDCANSGVDSLVFEGTYPTDAVEAIQYAATYPFRKQAAKIMILIADDDLPEEVVGPLDYLFSINKTRAATQKMLNRQGITFNVFSSYPTLNKKSIDSPILGVTSLGKQIINKKNSGEVGVDRLDIPKGEYARLAKASHGSMLGLSWLQTGHRDLYMMFSRMTWKQIQPQAQGENDFICRCVIGLYGESREECQLVR